MVGNNKPAKKLMVKEKNDKTKVIGVAAIWRNEKGESWTIDNRITREEWIAIFDESKKGRDGKYWLNVHGEGPSKGGFATPEPEEADASEPW